MRNPHAITTLYGPVAFDPLKHFVGKFDCGNVSVNGHVENELLHDKDYPQTDKSISVFYVRDNNDVQRVVACAVGKLVRQDLVTKRDCPPRIEIKLTAVDRSYQGLSLSGAATAHVVEALFAKAGVSQLEMRITNVILTAAHGLWARSGFQKMEGSDEQSPDMTMQIDREKVDWLVVRWQPRLRPDVVRAGSANDVAPV